MTVYKIWVTEAIKVYVTKELNIPLTGEVRFRSRVDSCSGAVTSTGCSITINYYWEDVFVNNGNLTATITGNTVIQSPNGNELANVAITDVYWTAGTCYGYSTLINTC